MSGSQVTILSAATLTRFTITQLDNVMGQIGPTGPSGGPIGPTGTTGATGIGIPGTQILSGSGAPDPGLGAVGDFYLDTSNGLLYGPKT